MGLAAADELSAHTKGSMDRSASRRCDSSFIVAVSCCRMSGYRTRTSSFDGGRTEEEEKKKLCGDRQRNLEAEINRMGLGARRRDAPFLYPRLIDQRLGCPLPSIER